jgi:hypothetical protein
MSLVAGERFTAKATRYLVLADLSLRRNDLSPSGNFDDVIKRIALRTVEEWPILHSQRPRLGSGSSQAASMQKRQAHADNADNHSSESANEGPPEIVVGMLLSEPSSFSFITRPTKRCLRNVRDTTERFCVVNALELRSPCGFYFWLSH